ncbi:MAG: hypothetical protein E7329_00255 [Clostridiales bacterium]|nr:hypothetical protein [Clostridiales bacterium]
MENKKHWWQEQPLTISAVQCNLGDDDNWVLDEYVAKYGFNTEQNLHLVANENSHFGYYSEEKHGKKLDAYLKKAHAHGIREIVYYNTHSISEQTSSEHPDWLQLTKDGQPMKAYSIYNLVCVNPNGPWHKNFLKEIEHLARHDIDGIFLDGPIMRDNGCYCDVCRADFEKRFGHSIYEGTRIELQTMRIESATRHVKETHDIVKSINPEIALYLNNSALRADITGSSTRKLYDYVDIIGAEGGFHEHRMGAAGLWQLSSKAKHLECIEGDTLAGKKPIVCFFAGNVSGISYYLHTPAETLLAYAQSYSNGSNVWYGVHFSASEFINTQSARTAKEMNEFVLGHRDIFGPSKVCARVALMWSQHTANNYASSVEDSDFVAARKSGFAERGDHFGELISVYDMLIRNHVQFDIIDEVSVLNGTIKQYDSVILPEVACLSDETAKLIAEYVAGGGNLLANFDVGMYNEDGSYAFQSKLADVLGIRGEPRIHLSPFIGVAYLFQEKNDPLLAPLTFPRIPAPILNAEWNYADDAQVLMRVNYPMAGRYTPLPGDDERYPALTKHAYGKGTAYYFSGNYGETAATHRNIVEYGKIIRRFVDLTSRSTVVSDASGLYEVVLRRQKDRFILHIINLTSAMSRPIEAVTPLYNVSFTLNLEGFGIEKDRFSIHSIRGAKVENVCESGWQISFTLNKIDAYEIIVIE